MESGTGIFQKSIIDAIYSIRKNSKRPDINSIFKALVKDNAKNIASVIKQKGETQNGCFKKAKRAKISEKQTFLTP